MRKVKLAALTRLYTVAANLDWRRLVRLAVVSPGLLSSCLSLSTRLFRLSREGEKREREIRGPGETVGRESKGREAEAA